MAQVQGVTLDHIVLEQFLKTLPEDVRVFVRERSPGTSGEAAKLADGYLQAWKEDLASREISRREGDKPRRGCLKLGHLARDCHVPAPESTQQKQTKGTDRFTASRSEHSKKDLKDVECYNCRKTARKMQ